MARQHVQLQADRRDTFGKKVSQLRRDGNVPGNVYGLKMDPIPLTINGLEFISVHQSVGATGVIDLAVNGADALPVLVQEVQHDPPTSRVLHVTFLQVDLTKPVSAIVPVFLIGQAPAVDFGANVIQHVNEVSVSALPDDIPENFEVDIGVLADFDHAVLVSDLIAPVGVTIQTDPNDLVVRAEHPRVVEEETPEEDEELEARKPKAKRANRLRRKKAESKFSGRHIEPRSVSAVWPSRPLPRKQNLSSANCRLLSARIDRIHSQPRIKYGQVLVHSLTGRWNSSHSISGMPTSPPSGTRPLPRDSSSN